MKFAIGTAQIGLNYGLKNKNIKISKKETNKIFNNLKKYKINYLDTARNYGNAEKLVGNHKINKIKIITKIPKLDLRKKIQEQIDYYFSLSLQNLNNKKVYALLLHESTQINTKKGRDIWFALLKLKKKHKIKKIGFSLYYPETLSKILSKNIIPDIVQIPYNILDRRFEEKNFLKRLKNKNIEIHVRSIFIQGLLLMNFNKINNYFKKYKNDLNIIKKYSLKNKISIKELALYFVLQNKSIDVIVIGIDNINQLKDLMRLKHKFNKRKNKKILIKEREFSSKLFLPINWKINY